MTAVEFLAERFNYIIWMRNRDEISAGTADEWRKNCIKEAKAKEAQQLKDFANWLQSSTEHLNHDFRDLVDEYLTNKDQHEVSKVKCDVCSYSWVAVRPLGLTKLECPNCGRLCSFENEA
jgi:hypothetical protein